MLRLRAAGAGDDVAFGELWAQVEAEVRAMVWDAVDAQETARVLVHKIFELAKRDVATLPDTGNFALWVLDVTAEQLDGHRQFVRLWDGILYEFIDREHVSVYDPRVRRLAQMTADELYVGMAMFATTPEVVSALTMRFVWGWSDEEVAQGLGLTTPTVDVIVGDAAVLLVERLTDRALAAESEAQGWDAADDAAVGGAGEVFAQIVQQQRAAVEWLAGVYADLGVTDVGVAEELAWLSQAMRDDPVGESRFRLALDQLPEAEQRLLMPPLTVAAIAERERKEPAEVATSVSFALRRLRRLLYGGDVHTRRCARLAAMTELAARVGVDELMRCARGYPAEQVSIFRLWCERRLAGVETALADLVATTVAHVTNRLATDLRRAAERTATEPVDTGPVPGVDAPGMIGAEEVRRVLAAAGRPAQLAGRVSAEHIATNFGITLADQEKWQHAVEANGVMVDVAPANPESIKWLEAGAVVPKPSTLKNKTATRLDVLLGLDPVNLGLVVCFEPVLPARPQGIPQREWELLYKRSTLRQREWARRGDVNIDSTGAVRIYDDDGRLRLVGSDYDPRAVRKLDGSLIEDRQTLDAYYRVFRYRHGLIEHGATAHWKTYSDATATAKRSMMGDHVTGGELLVRFEPGKPPYLVWSVEPRDGFPAVSTWPDPDPDDVTDPDLDADADAPVSLEFTDIVARIRAAYPPARSMLDGMPESRLWRGLKELDPLTRAHVLLAFVYGFDAQGLGVQEGPFRRRSLRVARSFVDTLVALPESADAPVPSPPRGSRVPHKADATVISALEWSLSDAEWELHSKGAPVRRKGNLVEFADGTRCRYQPFSRRAMRELAYSRLSEIHGFRAPTSTLWHGHKGWGTLTTLTSTEPPDAVGASVEEELEALGYTASQIPAVLEGWRESRSRKILVFCTAWGFTRGGVRSLNTNLCRALAARGHEVTVVVAEDVPGGSMIDPDSGVRIVGPNAADPEASVYDRLKLAWADLRSEGGFEAVLGHQNDLGRAAFEAAEDMGAPFVNFEHEHNEAAKMVTDEHRLGLELEYRGVALHGKAAAIVAVGEVNLHEANSKVVMSGRQDDPEVVELIPGVNVTPQLPPREDGGPLRVYVCGRDAPIKGFDAAAKMVHLLNRQGMDVELVVRGAGLETTERLCKLLGDKVIVKPPTSDPAVVRADMRSCDVVVMPSVAESFGLVGLEAAAAGVPVLVPETSGVGRFFARILDGIREWSCVEQGFEEAVPVLRWTKQLARMLRDLPASREQAWQLQDQLRRLNLTWDNAAQTVEKVIEGAIARPANPGPMGVELPDAFGPD